ncbi:MAG: hypothetical protein HIU91_09130 [Acidobacteria bacterium]|nr:hypothetical protein [Acidobacteriota bacterium]
MRRGPFWYSEGSCGWRAQQQIPFGNDRQKGKGKGDGDGKGKGAGARAGTAAARAMEPVATMEGVYMNWMNMGISVG